MTISASNPIRKEDRFPFKDLTLELNFFEEIPTVGMRLGAQVSLERLQALVVFG